MKSVCPLTKKDGDSVGFLLYGGTSNDDMEAMLSLRSSNGVKWRCRLSEYMEGGLLMSSSSSSSTGNVNGWVWGGGQSGRAYVWRGHDGCLVRCWAAHYRAITCLALSSCGGLLLSGGADGMVHSWNVLEIVGDSSEHSTTNSNWNDMNPHHTWSEHQLSVTALHALPANRALSTSTDRTLILMDLTNGTTLARILLPSALTSLVTDSCANRFYAGASDGAIYCVDASAYAIASTAESATVLSDTNTTTKATATATATRRAQQRHQSTSGTLLQETLLNEPNTNIPHQQQSSSLAELRGHERSVTALAVLEEDTESLLVSGGDDGTVRIWDLEARCCTRILHPWGDTPSTNTTASISSILLLPRPTNPNDDEYSRSDISLPLAPLRQYPQGSPHSDYGDYLTTDNNEDGFVERDMMLVLRQQDDALKFTTEHDHHIHPGQLNCLEKYRAKRQRLQSSLRRRKTHTQLIAEKTHHDHLTEQTQPQVDNNADTQLLQEDILALRKELAEANSTIDRWQKVNSTLLSKLEKARSPKKRK